MKEIEVSKEPVELFKILKFEGLAASGGEAKALIADGQVLVNGQVETRKRKQIAAGDYVCPTISPLQPIRDRGTLHCGDSDRPSCSVREDRPEFEAFRPLQV